MKIAYLVNVYPKASHSFIRREIRGLEELGFEIVRISVRPPATDLVDVRDREEARRTHVLFARGALVASSLRTLLAHPFAFLRGLRVALALGRRSDRGFLAQFAYLAEACALVELARREGIHHVHAHFGTNPPAVCCLAHVLAGLSYSFTVHGPEEFDRPGPLKLERKIAGARFVAAVSEFSRSQLYRWVEHSHWPKVQVVHCGLESGFYNTVQSSPPDVARLVCVGRLCEQKGQLLLVQAAVLLAQRGIPFELVLAGDGELRAPIEAALARHGLTERVRITGWISNERVREEILAARALVLPSFAEGLPVVLMEALALGRPVISTYVAGIPELVVPESSGWLVPAGDVEALTSAMRAALCADPAELEARGRRGAERVRANHDARNEARKLAELFRRAA